MALRTGRWRDALRRRALAARSAIAVTARRASVRQCRRGDRLSRTDARIFAIAHGNRRGAAPYRLAGPAAAAPAWPAARHAALGLGIVARRRAQPGCR